jgi:hypothetical protein
MKLITRLLSFAFLTALLAVVTLPLFTTLSVAMPGSCIIECKGNGNGNGNGNAHGAPGPIAGAGLPILAVGYGVYWLIRRRRKSD